MQAGGKSPHIRLGGWLGTLCFHRQGVHTHLAMSPAQAHLQRFHGAGVLHVTQPEAVGHHVQNFYAFLANRA
jgi:hypothetical protein